MEQREYKLHSRSQWEAQALFDGIWREAIKYCPGEWVPLGTDDLRVKKTGKKTVTAEWGRDPLSPFGGALREAPLRALSITDFSLL